MYLLIAIIVFAVLIILFIGIYNRVIRRKNQVDNAFGSIDAMLKKRYDLIPNLVETATQYMSYEKDILAKITELRVQALSESISEEDKIDLDNKISKAMGGIMVAVENYPDLKTNDQFLMLQRSWNEVEEQISASRRTFNASVVDYNNSIETFPANTIAGIFGFKRKLVFKIPDSERENISAEELLTN